MAWYLAIKVKMIKLCQFLFLKITYVVNGEYGGPPYKLIIQCLRSRGDVYIRFNTDQYTTLSLHFIFL